MARIVVAGWCGFHSLEICWRIRSTSVVLGDSAMMSCTSKQVAGRTPAMTQAWRILVMIPRQV